MINRVMTEDSDTAKLMVQMMVQDNAGVPFAGSAVVKMDGAVSTPTYGSNITLDTAGLIALNAGDEVLVPSPIKNTPSYRLVSFEMPLTLNKDTATPANRLETQTHNLSVAYGTKTINRSFDFQYMKDRIVITDMKYLPGYDGTGDIPPGVALNGAKVNSGEFYILVKTNTAAAAPVELLASYLPISTKGLTPEWIKSVSSTQYIFKISDFQNGNQTVRFNIKGSTAYKDVNISFASKNYIYVSNLTDGQSIVIDSKASKTLNIKGQYIDFNLSSQYFLAEMYVNGTKIRPTGATTTWLNSNGGFDVDLLIDATMGPLVFGENKIVFTGTGTDEKGQTREVRKELRIYILDENVSTISKFQPAVGTARSAFPDPTYGPTDELLTKLFNLTPDFIYKDNQYTTSLKTYDLVLRGSGAVKLNLNVGTKISCHSIFLLMRVHRLLKPNFCR